MDDYTTVVLKNRQSGMLVDHYASERVEAFSTDTDNSNRQWRRIVSGNFSIFKNVGTSHLLGHYLGEPMQARDNAEDLDNEHCQWEELVADEGFVALKNRATGMLLDHYREQSVQAYSAECSTLSQQWLLPFAYAEDLKAREPLTATTTVLDQYDIVGIKSVSSDKVLAHYEGERIEAYGDTMTIANSAFRENPKANFAKWYRIPLTHGFCAYKNVGSGKVLELYGGDSAQAFSGDMHLASHQWKELEVAEGGLAYMHGPDSEGGLVALQSRVSGKLLCHRTNESVQMVEDDEDEGFKKDKDLQWAVFWLTRVQVAEE